jgi:DNA polymerase-1
MLAYGGGAERFSDQTGITEAAAKQIIQKYKRIVPRLTTWLSNNGIRSARTKESFSADPYKRRRVLSEPEEWMNVNQGKNNPIQSAGANLTKLSMISLPAKYPIVLQLHDELVLEVPAKEAKKAVAVLRQVMQDSADYITGIHGIITVNPRIADNFLKQ